MTPKLLTRKIEIGRIGFSELFIKVIEIKRSSHPKIAIVCNLHGDEISSLFVVSKLIPKISKETTKGEVSFFTFSNPAAFLLRERTWKDHLDLNRIFPGEMNDSLTSRTAFKLSEELKRMDLVIDIHSTNLHTAILGLLMDKGDEDVKRRSLELLTIFSPDIIWKIKEKKYSNSLGMFLSRCGVVNFAIEMNPVEFLKCEEVNRISNGIEKVLAELKVIKHDIKIEKEKRVIPLVSRVKIVSEDSGLFFPLVDILKKVDRNEIIGRLTHDLVNYSVIRTFTRGIVMRISPMKFVDTGNEIASIGKIERWVK